MRWQSSRSTLTRMAGSPCRLTRRGVWPAICPMPIYGYPSPGHFRLPSICGGSTGCARTSRCGPPMRRTFLWQLADNQRVLCQAVTQAGLDIAFFESAAAPPILSPAQFRVIELPALKHVIAVAESCVGHAVPCIMGGDTFRVLDDLLATGTGYVICNVETDQRAFVRQARAMCPELTIRINMDPGIVTSNDRRRIYREVDRIVTIAQGDPRCLMGTGALPYEARPETIHWIEEYACSLD